MVGSESILRGHSSTMHLMDSVSSANVCDNTSTTAADVPRLRNIIPGIALELVMLMFSLRCGRQPLVQGAHGCFTSVAYLCPVNWWALGLHLQLLHGHQCLGLARHKWL